MKKNTLYIFVTAYLALLIQTPGRFVYGFTILAELFLLIIVGTLTISLIKKIQMEEVSTFIIMLTLISFTILFRQIVAIFYSEVALTLGYLFYFPTLSIFFLNNLFIYYDGSLSKRLVSNLKSSFIFILLGLLFFIFRDIAGYGTITFFGKNHNIYEKILINNSNIGFFSFVASIPGALILSGVILFVYHFVFRKMKIIRNMEKQQ